VAHRPRDRGGLGGFFGVNFFGTLAKRRERHMYVALWFYIATIVTVAMLHVFNNLWIPVGPSTGSRRARARLVDESYPIYAGCRTRSCSGGTGTTRWRSS
jgi:cbb3-type cytochrome oxidase subunit 1